MSYGNEIAIREDYLAKLPPLIEKHKGKLVVLQYDFQLQTWVNPGPQPVMINAWCFVVVTTGALVGEANWLSYVWTFHPTSPVPPNDEVLDDAVRHTFQRLGLMQLRQLQTQASQSPNQLGQSPN